MRLRTGHLARRVPLAALSVGALAVTAALIPGVAGVASAQAVTHAPVRERRCRHESR